MSFGQIPLESARQAAGPVGGPAKDYPASGTMQKGGRGDNLMAGETLRQPV